MRNLPSRRGFASRLLAAWIGSTALVAASSALAAPLISASGSAVTDPLVEAEHCSAARPALVEAPAATRPGAPGTTRVSIRVPPTTRVRQRAGAIVAAATNTGCAPHRDDVIVFVAEGRPARASEADRVVASFRGGDWREPGRWNAASP